MTVSAARQLRNLRRLESRAPQSALQDPATRCIVCASISRLASVPVTLTRRPTLPAGFSAFDDPTSFTGEAPFFRNPDFQLRAFGASAPVVSVRRNATPSPSRHPTTVARATFAAGVAGVGAGVAAAAAD